MSLSKQGRTESHTRFPALPSSDALLHTPLQLTSGKVDGGAPMRILAIDAAARRQQHLGSLQAMQVDGTSVRAFG